MDASSAGLSGLDPADRDAMIRTVLTEAGTPDGWGAVANVVKNRLAKGGFGDTPRAIVTAPSQFEVWSLGRAQKIDPKTPEYEAAGRVVDAVAAGDLPDNTNGATHYFAPAGMGSRPAPAWAKNHTVDVAGNSFFAPEGTVTYQAKPAATMAFAGNTQPMPKQPAASDDLSELGAWGVNLNAKPAGGVSAPSVTTTAQPAASAPSKPAGDLDELKNWGVDLTKTATPGQTASPANTEKPHGGATGSWGVDEIPTGDAYNAAGMGTLNRIPFVGPTALGGARYVAAAARALENNTPVKDELAKVQDYQDRTMAAHPYGAAAGGVVGAVAGTMPMLAAAPGLMGAGAGATSTNMLLGSISNGAIGAGDAAVRGENPIMGAAFGWAGGGLGPIAGKAIGRGVAAIPPAIGDAANAGWNYLRTGSTTGVPGISGATADIANKVINFDGGHEVVRNALAKYGPDAMIADTGPNATGITRGLSATPSEAKAVVENALKSRAAGAPDRISSQVEATVGPDQSNVALDKALKGIRSDYGSAYETVHANAPPVDAEGIIGTIDSQLKTATGPQKAALNKIRNSLVDTPEWQDPATGEVHPETYVDSSRVLHNVRQDVDNMIKYGDPTVGVQPSTLSRTQGSVGAVRSAIDDTLKKVPGMANADARSALMAENINAAAKGYDSVFGQNVPHPDDFAAARAEANPAVNANENQGMASRIHRAFGTGTQRSAVTLNKLLPGGEEGYSAQNLSTAFGEKPVNKLLDVLDREKAFNNTTQEAIYNSATNRGQAAADLLKETQPGSLNLLPATVQGIALQGAKKVAWDPLVKMIMESPNAPRNLELARLLTAQGATRDEIVTQLARLNGVQQGAGALGQYLQRQVTPGSNLLLRATGSTNRWDPQSGSAAR